ncbi:uncharacterized protein LOC142616588 [Castanea sativa]|uniref:uncharacterized protein LOC142616588 n=1 Tax=Castanea sativa TaxID=21020 RepID=UPI003F64B4E3
MGGLSDGSQQRRFWNRLWSLPLPPKVRHFTWRAGRDMLPTKLNLAKRGVVQDAYCDECRKEVESIQHALWTCPKARDAWECSKLVISDRSSRCQNFQDLMWLFLMEEEVEMDKVVLIVTIAWTLWHNKNEVKLGGERKPGKVIFKWAAQCIEEYEAVNVDGAIFSIQKSARVGVTIRDDRGRLEAAMSMKIHAPLRALEAEAKAFEASIIFTRDVGVQDIILEGDSMIMYRALSELSPPP